MYRSDFLFKVVVVGDKIVGKLSPYFAVLQRFVIHTRCGGVWGGVTPQVVGSGVIGSAGAVQCSESVVRGDECKIGD